MVSRKIEKARHGPGMIEVVLGAVLSLILGAALAVAYLVWKPVQVVDQLPKKQPFGMVYLVQGGGTSGSEAQWMRKQQLFAGGSSVEVNANEINAWYESTMEPAQGGSRAGGVSAFGGLIQLQAPLFRIQHGQLEMDSHGSLNLSWFDLSHRIIVQAAGHFVRRGGTFVFTADRFYVGSCPMYKLPIVGDLVLQHLLAARPPPEDITTSWRKLADVSIKANTLELKMP